MDFLKNLEGLTDETKEALRQQIEDHFVPRAQQEALLAERERLRAEAKRQSEAAAALQREADVRLKTEKLRHGLSKQGAADPDYLIYRQGGVDGFSFDENGEPVGLAALCETYRTDPTLSFLFSRGAYVPLRGGAVSVNPFAKETFNLTEQARLFREDPAAAGLLAAEAGAAFSVGGKK